MKKTYQQPLTSQVLVQAQNLMVNSPVGKRVYEGYANPEYEVLTRRRRRSVWDTDEEEDDELLLP